MKFNPFDRGGADGDLERRLRAIIARRGCGPVNPLGMNGVSPKGDIPPTYPINAYRPVSLVELKPRGERMVERRGEVRGC